MFLDIRRFDNRQWLKTVEPQSPARNCKKRVRCELEADLERLAAAARTTPMR